MCVVAILLLSVVLWHRALASTDFGNCWILHQQPRALASSGWQQLQVPLGAVISQCQWHRFLTSPNRRQLLGFPPFGEGLSRQHQSPGFRATAAAEAFKWVGMGPVVLSSFLPRSSITGLRVRWGSEPPTPNSRLLLAGFSEFGEDLHLWRRALASLGRQQLLWSPSSVSGLSRRQQTLASLGRQPLLDLPGSVGLESPISSSCLPWTTATAGSSEFGGGGLSRWCLIPCPLGCQWLQKFRVRWRYEPAPRCRCFPNARSCYSCPLIYYDLLGYGGRNNSCFFDPLNLAYSVVYLGFSTLGYGDLTQDT